MNELVDARCTIAYYITLDTFFGVFVRLSCSLFLSSVNSPNTVVALSRQIPANFLFFFVLFSRRELGRRAPSYEIVII